MSTKFSFHGAVRDRKHDVLKQASARDCNQQDEIGQSPTLLAAEVGDYVALSILVGRGGKLDQPNVYGETALHLAAQKGHLKIVKFLVEFGANIFALDRNMNNSLDMAHEAGHKGVIHYIDAVMASRTAEKPDQVEKLKKRAQEQARRQSKVAEKRDEMELKAQEKAVRKMSQQLSEQADSDMMIPSKDQLRAARPSFSAYTQDAGNKGKGKFSTLTKLLKKSISGGSSDTTRVLGGHRSYRSASQPQVMYAASSTLRSLNGLGGIVEDAPTRKPIKGLFSKNGLPADSGHISTAPATDMVDGVPGDRPAPGALFAGGRSFAFNPITSMLNNGFEPESEPEESEIEPKAEENGDTDGTNGVGDQAELSDEESEEEYSELDVFLAAHKLEESTMLIQDEGIDLDALLLITEDDLIREGFPLGPRKKIIAAVEKRKEAVGQSGKLTDSWC